MFNFTKKMSLVGLISQLVSLPGTIQSMREEFKGIMAELEDDAPGLSTTSINLLTGGLDLIKTVISQYHLTVTRVSFEIAEQNRFMLAIAKKIGMTNEEIGEFKLSYTKQSIKDSTLQLNKELIHILEKVRLTARGTSFDTMISKVIIDMQTNLDQKITEMIDGVENGFLEDIDMKGRKELKEAVSKIFNALKDLEDIKNVIKGTGSETTNS